MTQAYPLQYFRLFIGDTNNVVASSGSSLAPTKQVGNNTEKWYVNYKSSNVLVSKCRNRKGAHCIRLKSNFRKQFKFINSKLENRRSAKRL